MWLGAARLCESLCVVAHAWNRHCCGPFLASCAPLRLYDARTAASPALDLSRFGDAYGPKGGARNGSNLEGTRRALPRPFFGPADSRILEPLAQLETTFVCYARPRRGSRTLLANSTIALNAPKRLSPAETPRLHGRAATLAVLSLWCHTCRTTRARYRGASRSHRAAAHAIKCWPSRKTRATRMH